MHSAPVSKEWMSYSRIDIGNLARPISPLAMINFGSAADKLLVRCSRLIIDTLDHR